MSNIYIQEPPTNGKILLKTTAGDIDIELWSKEAPKACRNFIQLCMEEYGLSIGPETTKEIIKQNIEDIELQSEPSDTFKLVS